MGKRWTDDEIHLLLDNYKTQSKEWLSEKTNHSINSVKSKLSSLKVLKSNRWTSEEDAKLKEVWGSPRYAIEKALPNHKWRYIRTRALVKLNLEELSIVRNAVTANFLLKAFHYSWNDLNKWIKFGLQVKKDKGKDKVARFYINIKKFWDFFIKHTDIIDIHRLETGGLGVEPEEVRKLRKIAIPKSRVKRLSNEAKIQAVKLYLTNNKTAKEMAECLGIREDSFRKIVCKYRNNGTIKGKKFPRAVRSPGFSMQLEGLYYNKKLTVNACVQKLKEQGVKCSRTTVVRELKEIRERKSKGVNNI